MTTQRKQYFALIFLTILVFANAQIDEQYRDSIKRDQEKRYLERSKIYKQIIKDTSELVGVLVDMTSIVGCGHYGEGVIRLLPSSTNLKANKDTICIVVQCMDIFKDILKINKTLRLLITPNKLPHYRDFGWWKCDNRIYYYLLRAQLTAVD
jgi:hypothetical protein